MKDGKHVILCIDDDTDILEALKLILENKGDYIFVSAPSAEDGIKAFKKHEPDLIIVDLMMEEVDAGTSFTREIKALGNKAPVYMLSSVGNELHQSIDASELGLAGIFQKPIQADTLLNTIKAKLG